MRTFLILIVSCLGAIAQASETTFEDVLAAVSRMGQAQREVSNLSTVGRPAPSTPRANAICPLRNPVARATPEVHAQWAGEGFTNPEVTAIDLRNCSPLASRATHEFDLTAIVFRDTGWDPEAVRRALPIMSDVYAQCGVRIATANFVFANPAYRQPDFTERGQEDVADAVPDGYPKPHLFFGRRVTDPKLPSASAHAYMRDGCRGKPTCETAWLTSSVMTSNHKYPALRNDAVAFAIAHEAGHILTNVDSEEERDTNLMNHTVGRLNGSLTPAQCQAIRSNRLVRPIAR